MRSLLTLSLLFFSSGFLSAQSSYHRPSGMPENELVAFDQFKPSEETSTLRGLLEIRSFRWMVQIPKDARLVFVTLSLVDTRTKKSRTVNRFELNPIPADPELREKRPTFFPLTLTLMPEELKTGEPWLASRRLLTLLEIPDLPLSIRRACPNPFHRHKQGVSTFSTTRLATPIERAPDRFDGLGTAFDIMSSGHADEYTLRVTFSTSP